MAVHYTRAGTVREGFSGLERGLALIEGLLDRHWGSVHPQLDASDDDDPTARVNALSALVDGRGARWAICATCRSSRRAASAASHCASSM